MGELGALFNPGMRHELEERRSKAARREEEGNARDGDVRIDLDSGVAVINVPGAETGADASPGEGSGGQESDNNSSSGRASGGQDSQHQESSAQASGAHASGDQASGA